MDADETKLFVGGISKGTTEDMLKHHFDKYGIVLGCIIGKDRATKNPRGFGFVSFSDASAAERALEDTHVILGRKVDVKKAIPKNEQQHQRQPNQQHNSGLSNNDSNGDSNGQFSNKKIFVGGLATNLTEEEFKNYFERFGRITDVVVMHDRMTDRPRGFGFVTFDSEESVKNVVQNRYHELNGRHVEVKRAVPKEGTNGSNGGLNSRYVAGRLSPFNSFHSGDYPPQSPGYGAFPGYAPLPGYNGVGGYPLGTGIFGGGYAATGGYTRIGSGVNTVAPGSLWYGPMMVGPRVLPPAYVNTAVYPAYMDGGFGFMGMSVGGYISVQPGVDGKLNQYLSGYEHVSANSAAPGIEGVKLVVDSTGLNRTNGGASEGQNQGGS